MSATYIVDVKVLHILPCVVSITQSCAQANQTLPLSGPTDKTAGSIFATSITSIVQLTPSGQLFFLNVDQADIAGKAANAAAGWKSLATLPGGGTSDNGSKTGVPNASNTRNPADATGSPTTGNADQGGSDEDGDNAAGRLSAVSWLVLAIPAALAFMF